MRRANGYRHSYQKSSKISQFSLPEKKRLYILAAGLLTICLAGIVFTPKIGGVALYRQRQQALAAQEINAKLRIDNEQGQKSINTAKKNPDFLEEVSRAQFNLVQQDEVILDYSKRK